jgi:hypothetical protein
MQTIQPSSYTRSSAISATILLILLWGFHRTYTVFFPAFEGFQFVQHFHGFMMLLWMFMLVVQPLLIARRNYALHRLIGRSSLVVDPLVLLSIFFVAEMVYFRDLETKSPADAFAGILLPIPGLIAFAILYLLAMVNRHRTYYHMRYMIGTGVLMIGPGLGRILGIWIGVPGPLVVTVTLIVVAMVSLAFLVIDVVKKRDVKPYAIVAVLMVVQSVLWEVRYLELPQSMASAFARLAF